MDNLDFLFASFVLAFMIAALGLLAFNNTAVDHPITEISNTNIKTDQADTVMLYHKTTGSKYVLHNATPYSIESGSYNIVAMTDYPSNGGEKIYKAQVDLAQNKSYNVNVTDKKIIFNW